ncbi:MAG: hypothetical protein DWP97_11480 [Calditrichaeota bacterium]|nr:MAG: hypothetical protein DWP97_11480 [Calditrichota bacterium]
MKIYQIAYVVVILSCGIFINKSSSEQITISDIPYSNWIFYRDVSSHALVSVDTTRQNLYLHRFDSTVLHIPSSENHVYMMTQLCENRGLFLAGKFQDKSNYHYSLYDFNGNLLHPQFEVPYLLNLSQNGEYYLTRFDVGYATNRPALISLRGETMFEFVPEYETGWDLKEIDSTTVLFRDGGKIYIYNVSDFSLVDVIDTGVDNLEYVPSKSIVTGNRYYGFRTYAEIIIVDLHSGNVKAKLPKSMQNKMYRNPGILIDAEHQRLLLFYSSISSSMVEIYSFEKSKLKLIYQFEILIQDITGFSEELSFVHKGFYILNFYRSRNPDVYRSMIITLLQDEQTPELLPGMLFPKPDGSGELMQISLVNHTLKIMDFIDIE